MKSIEDMSTKRFEVTEIEKNQIKGKNVSEVIKHLNVRVISLCPMIIRKILQRERTPS